MLAQPVADSAEVDSLIRDGVLAHFDEVGLDCRARSGGALHDPARPSPTGARSIADALR